MSKNKKDDKQEHSDVIYMPIFMSIGMSVGVALGAVFDNIPVAMCVGMCAGLCIGNLIDAVNRSKKNAATKEDDEGEDDTSEE